MALQLDRERETVPELVQMAGIFKADALVTELRPLAGETGGKHCLLSSQVRLYAQITQGTNESMVVDTVLVQLDAFTDLLHDDKNSEFLQCLTQPVLLSMAKNYTALLTRSKTRLFDTTNKFISTFTESKRPAPLRNMACVVLTSLYESFGREVVSFIPVLLMSILKYFKKEKFEVNLSRLWYAILRNGGSLELNDSLVSKYHKLLKNTDSIEALSFLFGSLGYVASSAKVDTITFKTQNHSLIQLGLDSHKNVRSQTAKALAESMVLSDWDLKLCLELYVDLYLDGTSREQELGVLESLIHFTSMKLVRNFDFLTHNMLTILETLITLFDHERFHAFSSNRKYRIVNHFIYYSKHITNEISESTSLLLLDLTIPKLDIDLPIWTTLGLLKISESLLSKLSGVSDGRVERYRITIWKLCLSSSHDIQINAVLVLKQIAVKSPSIINELLETSLNEVINNTKQQSSDKIAIKTHGMALIIANLISLADKDYVPQTVIEGIWNSSLELIKQNLKLTKSNHHILVVSWISIAGVFTYHDMAYLDSLRDQFLATWSALDMTGSMQNLPLETLTVISHASIAALSLLKNVNVSITGLKAIVDKLASLRTILATVRTNPAAEPLVDFVRKRSHQIFLICVEYVKAENSSILIQSVAHFSELPNYHSSIKNEVVTPWTKDDDYCNGITSKFHGYEVDELFIKLAVVEYPQVKDFSIDHSPRPKGSIESNNIKSWTSDSTWVDDLESNLNSPVSSALEIDPLQTIFGDYSTFNAYSPPSRTCLIDASVEIFSKSFPYLSTKVQLSILETLRSYMLSKVSSESTKIAQAVNGSIAIHGVLSIAHKESLNFDQQVGSVLLETLRSLYVAHPVRSLLTLNAESVGILISRTDLKEQIPIFLKKIVDEQDSNSRAFNALVLSYIYRYNASHFSDISEMLLKLSQDAHPIVHAWSMDSLSTIIEKHLSMSRDKAIETLRILDNCFLDDKFGANSSTVNSNLNCDVDSNRVIMRVLRTVINSVGPAVKELDKESKSIIENLIFGAVWLSNDTNEHLEALKLIQELIVYDSHHFKMANIVTILQRLIQGNLGMALGSGLLFSVYEEENEVFATTSSFKTLETALELLSQLVKTSEDKSFIKTIEPLIWICLEKFPDSKILSGLITEWIDDTYDISWFTKLLKLFNASEQELSRPFTKQNEESLNKYTHKKRVVDVTDEEAQSITKANGEDQKGEPVSSGFKINIVGFLRQLLSYTKRDSMLYSQISSRISELVKVSFASSTSTSLQLRLAGINLLGEIITIYAPARDPIYPTMSLLEQQQAQITAALTPAFQHGSTPLLASEAIKVIATFVGSGVVKVSKLGRISKILTGALEDLQHQDEFRINDVFVTSEVGQRRIKLAILNAWAELKILNNNRNEELDNLVKDHIELLLPLWISTLKEFALIRHGKGENDEFFQNCWVNLVDVIGCFTETEIPLIETLLQNDALGFYYMLYSHCLFALLKNEDRLRILLVLVKILNFRDLLKLVYHDNIFHESMEIFERLLVTGDEEEQLVVLDITSQLFLNYFEVNEGVDFSEHADKLFDILRVNMQTSTHFISNHGEELKELNETELKVVKKGLGSVSKMISKFPDMIKSDLYASVLSIFARIYASSSAAQLVPQVLPILKDIITNLIEMNDISTVNNFYQTVKHALTTPFITILTLSVLLSSASVFLRLGQKDVDLIVSSLIQGLQDPETVPLSTQAVKSIVNSQTVTNDAILRQLVIELTLCTLEAEDPRLFVELLILIIKQHSTIEMYTILIPTLLQIEDVNSHMRDYIHKRMMSLISISSESFKSTIGALDESQRQKVEALVKIGQVGERQDDVGHIQLKTFE